jgi:hypothetical protein
MKLAALLKWQPWYSKWDESFRRLVEATAIAKRTEVGSHHCLRGLGQTLYETSSDLLLPKAAIVVTAISEANSASAVVAWQSPFE